MTVTPATRLHGVVGDPVSHSLSPLIHNRWIAEARIDAVYVALRLKTDDAAGDLRALARAGFSGLNVTLPHKIAACRSASDMSPEAARLGAANMLTRGVGDGWTAHNTDVEGFSLAFDQATGARASDRLTGKRVVLIGAGGAARAAAMVLADRGASLAIVNRTRARAEALSAALAPAAESGDMASLGALAREADAIVNSASLGHEGGILPALPPGDGRPVLDLSYGRAARDVLAAAAAAGWTPHDGLGMLVGQAAASFRLWFGVTPDSDGALKACRSIVAVRG